MHRPALARTQRRTRRAWSSARHRRTTLKNWLPRNRTSGYGTRAADRHSRLHRRRSRTQRSLVHRPWPGLRNDHARQGRRWTGAAGRAATGADGGALAETTGGAAAAGTCGAAGMGRTGGALTGDDAAGGATTGRAGTTGAAGGAVTGRPAAPPQASWRLVRLPAC